MLIKVMCINADTDVVYYSNIEDWRKFPTLKDIFRQARIEYGRCVGRLYGYPTECREKTSLLLEDAVPVGWIFRRQCYYKDSEETFSQETWLTFVEVIPEQHIPQSLRSIASAQARSHKICGGE